MNTVLSKLILCCSLLLFSLNIHAANYYFSDKTGNDSRSSSQAQNPDTPWKSISKLNAFFTDLNPGDKVFFKRGEVFSGEIILNNSGSSDRPIIIGAYGTGSKPVITSIVHLTNWKSIGNGIFESSHPDLDFNELNVVLLNNEKQEMGRYPNSDAPNKGYLNYEFSSGNQSITSKELNASPNWSGAEVVVRKNFWVIDRHRITNHSGNTVNYAPNPESSYHPTANYGFFIQNHVKTLDKLGEWYYNSSSKKFNMYFGNSSPGSPSVEVSTSDHIVTNSKSTSNIVFENLHFRGANKNVLFLEGGSNIKVLACDIEYGGDNGLFMNGIVDFEIANSTVIGSGNNGILLGTSKNAIVRNNLVKDTYLLPGLTRGGDNRGVSISTTSDNNLIENNQVINSGYIGIRFGGNQTIVRNNLINYFCLTKNDGGGIYAYGSKSTTHSGRKVSNNIILNGIGVKEGSNLRNHLSLPQAEGIYLDDNVTGVEITGNTVAHVSSRGIYLHNTDKILVKDNLVFDSGDLFYAKNDHMGNPLRNTLVEENIFITKDAYQNHMLLYSNARDIDSFGSFDNNYYASPSSDDFRFNTLLKLKSSTEHQTFNLKTWQSSQKQEPNGKFSSYKQAPYMVKEINGENKYDNSEFNSHVRNVGCNNCDPNWGNSGKLDGGTLKVSFSEHGLLSMGIGEVKEGKKYVMKFSTIGDKNIPLTAYVRQSGSPWQQISGLHTIEVSSKRQEHELIFSPKVGMDNSRVEFRLSQKMDANVWMDNLEFYEIDHEEIKQEDFLLFEYNATQSKKTIPLNGDYVDAKNGEFSNKVVLDPFQSVLLLKTSASSSEPEPDPYPEIQIESPANNSEFRAGEEIEINVKASLKEGSIKRVDFFNDGKLIGSSNDAPFSYIWKEANVEEIKLSAVAIGDNGNQKNSDIILLNVLPAPVTKDIDQPSDRDFSLFLNVGSDVNTSLEDINFHGESNSNIYYNSSKTHFNEISSTQLLFQSERFAKKLVYRIPVPNGTYSVQTLHNETYFGKKGPTKEKGRRVFDIRLEGKTVKDNLDLFEESDNNPVILTFQNIKVTDGLLNLELISSENNATLSGLIVQDISLPSPEIKVAETSSPAGDLTDLDMLPENLQNSILLNIGSDLSVNYLGQSFMGDENGNHFTNTRVYVNTKASELELFQTERVGKNLVFEMPISNGIYKIITYHNELWFGSDGDGPAAKEGNRVFDITMEGKTLKRKFDIFKENKNLPIALTFDKITITDGELNIEMKASSDHATISGIAIIPISEEAISKELDPAKPIYLNTGTKSSTTFDKTNFLGDVADNFHNSSKTNLNSSVTNIKLFESERYAKNLSYDIPIENGRYTVLTYHHELWFGSYGPSAKAGRRVFNISLEGKLVKSNFDIFLESRNQPIVLTFEDVEVKDGVLNIDLDASVNNATISGLAIVPKSSKSFLPYANLRELPDESEMANFRKSNPTTTTEITKGRVRLYPNPASWEAKVKFNQDVILKLISIHTTNGQLVKTFNLSDSRQENNMFILPIYDLKDGIYIITLLGDNQLVEKLKLVVKQ